MKWMPILAIVAGAAVISGGCKRENRQPGGDTTMTAVPPATVTDTSHMEMARGGPMSDANIVYVLDEANASDSARGALAMSKGTSPDVRNFGRSMTVDHHRLRADGQALAKRLNVTPQAPMNDSSKVHDTAMLDSLKSMPKGAAWDRAYITDEVAAHRAVLETATAASNTTQNADLKALIEKASPVIQRHLEEAQRIEGKLSK